MPAIEYQPIRAGDSILSITTRRIGRGPLKGNYRGMVKVSNQKNPEATYAVMTDRNAVRPRSLDALEDAHQLRREIIEQNGVKS